MQSLRRSGYVLKFSDRNVQKKPRPLGSRGESLRLLAVWGTLIHRPCVPDASASDCKSMFCEGDGQHKKAALKTAKPPAVRSQRLCLRPPYGPFQRRQLGRRTMRLLRPILPLKKGDARSDRKDYRSHDGFFATSRVARWGKAGPDGSVSGPSFTHWQLGTWGNYTARSGKK